jgi:hypothetical protein
VEWESGKKWKADDNQKSLTFHAEESAQYPGREDFALKVEQKN